jgi:spermidine/putrescine transport system permease protein
MRISRRLAVVFLLPLSLLLIVGGLVPAGILFVYSFYDYRLFQLTPAFHTTWYRTILSDPVYRTVTWNTLAIALPTVLATVAGGYTIAYYLAFKAKRSRTPVFALVVISMLASYLARIYAWRTLMGGTGIINSTLMAAGVIRQPIGWLIFSRVPVILAEINLYLPIATLIMFASLSGIPPELEEAARDLGAGRAQALRRVIIPPTGAALIGASALCFFLSAGDYVTPAFLGGVASSQTLGTTIATAITTEGNYPLGSALSFGMVAVFAVYTVVLVVALRAAHFLPRRAR